MPADDAAVEDVVAWRARTQARRLAEILTPSVTPAAEPPADPLDDRLADLVRPETMGPVVTFARDAAPGRTGETDRARLREILDPFLRHAGAETARELARALRDREPPGGFRDPILRCVDPVERRRLHREWERCEESIVPRRLEHRRALDAAAVSVGASSCPHLVGLAAPVSPAVTAAEAERLAIAPLDAAFAQAAGDRRKRFQPPLPGSPEPSEAIPLAWLSDHHDLLDRRGIGRRLRVLAHALGFDPDARGPAIRADASAPEEPEALEWLEPAPAVVIGTWVGPAALAGGLEALGRAVRAMSVRHAHGAAAGASSDPAFAAAAGLLLRRLVLSARFLDWTEIKADAGLHADLRFEETARIRLAWAGADGAARGEAGPEPAFVESLERAIGRPASPDLLARSWEADPGGPAILRGAAFAILVEERLRTRAGHLWFRDERSPRFLREIWEAEPGETAESIADALGLGRMDALLLFDGYRL